MHSSRLAHALLSLTPKLGPYVLRVLVWTRGSFGPTWRSCTVLLGLQFLSGDALTCELIISHVWWSDCLLYQACPGRPSSGHVNLHLLSPNSSILMNCAQPEYIQIYQLNDNYLAALSVLAFLFCCCMIGRCKIVSLTSKVTSLSSNFLAYLQKYHCLVCISKSLKDTDLLKLVLGLIMNQCVLRRTIMSGAHTTEFRMATGPSNWETDFRWSFHSPYRAHRCMQTRYNKQTTVQSLCSWLIEL